MKKIPKPMNHILRVVLLIMILLPAQKGLHAADTGDNHLNLPPVKHSVLNNGLKIFYVHDDLPRISITAVIRFGKLYEKRENAGIAALMARTLALGGSEKYPGARLHSTIDSMGGRLTIASSWEETRITLKVLSRFRKQAFRIMSDILLHPRLNRKALKTAKGLLIDQIRRKYDNPAQIAFEKTRQIIFNGIGYGAVTAEKTLNSISEAALIKTWTQHVSAHNMLIGIIDSIDARRIEQNSRTAFSQLPPGKRIEYPMDPIKLQKRIHEKSQTIYLYPKDIPQATVVIGTPGPSIKSPSHYPLRVMNYILGGGSFSSRLVKEIRVKRGLAYAVQSVIRFREKGGVFLAYAQTKNSTVPDVLTLLRNNIHTVTSTNPEKSEIEWAKKSISNSYIFDFDTSAALLNEYMEREIYRLPEDYYNTYITHIKSVTPTKIQKNAQKLFSNSYITVIIGKKSIINTIKMFGPVTILQKRER